MVEKEDLSKKLDEVLERLRYLEMVIRNLKERKGTPIADLGNVDERLFREIADFELSTEEMKRDFVMLLMQDAQRLADACIHNINLYDKTLESLSRIDDLMNFINDHETVDIKESRNLQRLTEKAKSELNEIKKRTSKIVEEKIKEKRSYNKNQARVRYLK